MRTLPTHITSLWSSGGPFIGTDGAPHGRVTVEKDWYLTENSSVSTTDPQKYPFRWFQRINNSQVETEVPNVKSIDVDRTLDADAAQCTIQLYNQWHQLNTNTNTLELGEPGYFTFNHAEGDAGVRWGHSTNTWNDVLIPNALLRTYQGYGGKTKTISQAVADGNIVLTGVWLIDDVTIDTDGILTVKCRDMAKLLIEQQLYPPLVPSGLYPLKYRRWIPHTVTNPPVPVYDYTDPVENAPEGWPKYITDISISADGKGYWVVGTDGGVFSFNVPFYGSRGTELENAKMSTMCADPLNRGYWLFGEDGGVFTFGEVAYYGDPVGSTVSPIIAAAAHPNGRGYAMVDKEGHVYTYGSFLYYGGEPVGASEIVDIHVTPSGNGYWLLDEDGHIYTYGDAVFHGGADGPFLYGRAVGMATTPDGDGYWVVTETGQIWTLGEAPSLQHNGPDWEDSVMPFLNDPIFSIDATPTGNGFLLVGGDGGVFSFGDGPFWGSLPEGFTYTYYTDGEYTDYAHIIRDMLLWSGWLAYGASDAEVYGTMETTGAWSEDELPPDMFDKRPVIDAINAIKEIVGYHFWVDEEGAAWFVSPNWYTYGNLIEDGSRIQVVPEIDEKLQLTQYAISYHDTNVRSELIITNRDPNFALDNTIVTRHDFRQDDFMAPLLRGMVRPAMWVNEHFLKEDEQQRMVELISDHIQYSLRQGTLSCAANPAIQINDQVRIYERVTSETFIHYVKGINTHMDLDTGEYVAQLTTVWLGPDFGGDEGAAR